MNDLTHFATGYLIARGMKYESDRFETFFLGVAALVPDFDLVAGGLIPGAVHAGFSHTILGGLVFATAFMLFSWLVLRKFLRRLGIPPARLFALSLAGLASHLVLDIFTYSGDCVGRRAHVYFWPLWNQSFHLDCLFPGIELRHRVLVEIAYSLVIGATIVLWDWKKNRMNPFHAFSPERWRARARAYAAEGRCPGSVFAYLGVLTALVVIYLMGLIL